MSRSNNVPFRIRPNEEMSYYKSGAGADDLLEQQTVYNYYSANAFATYKDTFKDAHNLTVVLGYNYENRNYKRVIESAEHRYS